MTTRTEEQRQQCLYSLTATRYSLRRTEETCQKTKIITSIEYSIGTKDHWVGNAPVSTGAQARLATTAPSASSDSTGIRLVC